MRNRLKTRTAEGCFTTTYCPLKGVAVALHKCPIMSIIEWCWRLLG